MLSQFGSLVDRHPLRHATGLLLSAAAMAMKHINPQLVTDVLCGHEGLADFQLVNSPETAFAAMMCCTWLQMHVEVQAFLTLPDLTAEGAELDDYCQVIKPFSIETAVDHCVEPTSTGNYRCAYNHLLQTCVVPYVGIMFLPCQIVHNALLL